MIDMVELSASVAVLPRWYTGLRSDGGDVIGTRKRGATVETRLMTAELSSSFHRNLSSPRCPF